MKTQHWPHAKVGRLLRMYDIRIKQNTYTTSRVKTKSSALPLHNDNQTPLQQILPTALH